MEIVGILSYGIRQTRARSVPTHPWLLSAFVLADSALPRSLAYRISSGYVVSRASYRAVAGSACLGRKQLMEQPCLEQPPADPQARTPDVRLSQPETHTEISPLLRADPATFRAQTVSATRFNLSKTTRGAIRHMARNHGTRPKSVDWLLNNRPPCRCFVSLPAS